MKRLLFLAFFVPLFCQGQATDSLVRAKISANILTNNERLNTAAKLRDVLNGMVDWVTKRSVMVTPDMFGAIPGDGIDDTFAFQKALSHPCNNVYVNKGEWTIMGTVDVGSYQTLTMNANAILNKPAYAANTEPVLVAHGIKWKVSGGRVFSLVASPKGVVTVGNKWNQSENAWYWIFEDVEIRGVVDTREIPDNSDGRTVGTFRNTMERGIPNVGLLIHDGSHYGGGGGRNYFGTVRDVKIQTADIGLLQDAESNAMHLENIHTWYCRVNIDIIRPIDTYLAGAFFHNSYDYSIGIRLRTTEGSTGYASQVYGVRSEMTGQYSMAYYVKSGVSLPIPFDIYQNQAASSIDENVRNFTVSNVYENLSTTSELTAFYDRPNGRDLFGDDTLVLASIKSAIFATTSQQHGGVFVDADIIAMNPDGLLQRKQRVSYYLERSRNQSQVTLTQISSFGNDLLKVYEDTTANIGYIVLLPISNSGHYWDVSVKMKVYGANSTGFGGLNRLFLTPYETPPKRNTIPAKLL